MEELCREVLRETARALGIPDFESLEVTGPCRVEVVKEIVYPPEPGPLLRVVCNNEVVVELFITGPKRLEDYIMIAEQFAVFANLCASTEDGEGGSREAGRQAGGPVGGLAAEGEGASGRGFRRGSGLPG